MANDEAPYVDTQSLSDTSADIYEAIATLEHAGRRASRSELADITALPDQVIDESLADMVGHGLLTSSDDGEGEVYVPARRGWSAAPDQTTGQKSF
jgi:hypothetical protein